MFRVMNFVGQDLALTTEQRQIRVVINQLAELFFFFVKLCIKPDQLDQCQEVRILELRRDLASLRIFVRQHVVDYCLVTHIGFFTGSHVLVLLQLLLTFGDLFVGFRVDFECFVDLSEAVLVQVKLMTLWLSQDRR